MNAPSGTGSADTSQVFKTLLEALPDIVYVLDPEGRFLYLNGAVRSIGYEPEFLAGRHFSEIIHPDDRGKVSREEVVALIRKGSGWPDQAPKLFDERRSGARMTRDLEVRILKGDTKETLYVSVNAYGAPPTEPVLHDLFEARGQVTIGIIHDITARKRYADSLEESLAAKQLLMREMHHRVQTNLQVVASLAHLKAMETGDAGARGALDSLVAQVQSVALVHEILSAAENSGGVDAEEYFGRFARRLRENFAPIGAAISLAWTVEPLRLDVDFLTAHAMIAGELISGAYGRAKPGMENGRIELVFSREGDEIVLVVRDNFSGPEFSGSADDIVDALTAQVGGRLSAIREEKGWGGFSLRSPLSPEHG